MGYMKERYYSRGLTPLDGKTVCAACAGDPDISDFIAANADRTGCTYCLRADCPSVDVDEVALFVLDGIESEYEDAANNVAYEGAEGGYIPPCDHYDTSHLLVELLDGEEINQTYLHDLVVALPDRIWVHKDPYAPTPSERLRWDWTRFCKQIMHETRYLFLRDDDDDDDAEWTDDLPPFFVMEAVMRTISDLNLVRAIPSGSTIYRARVHSCDEHPVSAADLGPPPVEMAIQSNRMSPAGIPMFYGACDVDTALEEVNYQALSPGQAVTIAEFQTVRDLNVVDLTQLPPVPGFFDREAKDLRRRVAFYRSFVDDLAKPIAKDGHEHVEYVPSQVVTEFMRHVFKPSPSESTHGMLYPSTQHEGGVCCVFFCDGTGVTDAQSVAQRGDDVMMELVPGGARPVLDAAPPS